MDKNTSRVRKWIVLLSIPICIGLFILSAHSSVVMASDGIWYDVEQTSILLQEPRLIVPARYRTMGLNVENLQRLLASAPLERSSEARAAHVVLPLPLPDGSFGRFRIVNSPIMAPELAAKFPEITTYAGQGLDDPTATVRLDWTPAGFHAMILSHDDTIYIDPYSRHDTTHYISYFKRNARSKAAAEFIKYPPIDAKSRMKKEIAGIEFASSGTQLRTYRLAVAATGEYTQYHGGTVALGQAAIVTAINRVSGIYEVELAVRLQLVANNNLLVYTNPATDPYSNNSASALLSENQSNTDIVIGNANYDIGHVFGTGGGGLAGLGVVCDNTSKARGETGSSAPTGDPYYVDYVAHEMGHQFNGNHTFNGSTGSCTGGNRNGATAYEPGSGSTIQAYAGICAPQNLQPNSDDHFHTKSFDEMVAYTTVGIGSTCGSVTATGNNPPVPEAGTGGFTIPANTPFELTGSATDPNGDPLTYNWEEFDLGPAGHPDTPSGNAPIFRSFPASTSPTRIFPKISDIINNTHTIGELLPSYSRTLTFRLTARDNRSGGGGVDYDTISFNVEGSAGPFQVTSPNTAVTWTGNGSETVIWNMANTDSSPVSCANVDILLSSDGGSTFPISVLTNTPNDGSQTVTVPNNPTTTARIKIKCANNIFFDISNTNFTLVAGTPSINYLLWTK